MKYSQAIFDLEKAKEIIALLQTEQNKILSQSANYEQFLEKAMNDVKISQAEPAEELPMKQVNSLKKQIDELKKENDVLKEEKNLLKKENGSLNARMKQIQSSIQMNKSLTGNKNYADSSEEEEDYEVEQILTHKTSKSGRKFLIRWKEYGPRHDSWVDEKNLNCSKILNAYLKMNKL